MAPPSSTKPVRARALSHADKDQAIACLLRNFPERDEAYWRRGWERLAARERFVDLPRFGHCLESDGVIVGVLLMIYSTRGEGANAAVVANLSSWCVDVPYRAFSGGLTAAATQNKAVLYLNISAAPHTWRGVEAQGYRRYNAGQHVFSPLLAKRAPGARARMFDANMAPSALEDGERALLADHARLGCKTFVVDCDGRSHGFATIGDRVLRGMIKCEQVVYCAGEETLRRFAGVIGRDLRLRLMIVDANGPIAGLPGKFIAGRNRKYAKGPIQPTLGDLAYTELVYFGRDPSTGL